MIKKKIFNRYSLVGIIVSIIIKYFIIRNLNCTSACSTIDYIFAFIGGLDLYIFFLSPIGYYYVFKKLNFDEIPTLNKIDLWIESIISWYLIATSFTVGFISIGLMYALRGAP
jgi:hypothetical protein